MRYGVSGSMCRNIADHELLVGAAMCLAHDVCFDVAHRWPSEMGGVGAGAIVGRSGGGVVNRLRLPITSSICS